MNVDDSLPLQVIHEAPADNMIDIKAHMETQHGGVYSGFLKNITDFVDELPFTIELSFIIELPLIIELPIIAQLSFTIELSSMKNQCASFPAFGRDLGKPHCFS